ncbi:MAG: pyridoxamine 5'-phosphate oxidase [Phycisphaerales bacterium JB059]
MSQSDLSDVFEVGEGLPDELPADPMPTFKGWLEEATARAEVPNPNAMTLATVGEDGRPSARIVLCKGVVPDPGYVVFYTNSRSRKGREIEANPRVALTFHWDHAGRQVRLEGRAIRSPDEESDAYFASRHWTSRLGAHASEQSEPIESRQALLERVAERAIDLGLDLGALLEGRDVEIPRPAHWFGYRVWVDRVELWCGGTGRIHDRAAWTRELGAGQTPTTGAWSGVRLQP